MLIGQGLYYNVKTGKRTNDMDRDVCPEDVAQATDIYPHLIGQWSCRNGDPKDIRYFRAGKQIKKSELPAAMQSSKETYDE